MNTIQIDDRQISALWPATDEELLSVIGASALPLVMPPSSILQGGRTGEFYYDGSEALGLQFDHPAFKRYAILFFKTWSSQLTNAVCKNSPLAEDLKNVTIEKRDIAVGLVVGALTAHIPELAAYAGLLTALAIFIVKSGMQAFCETVSSLKSGPA